MFLNISARALRPLMQSLATRSHVSHAANQPSLPLICNVYISEGQNQDIISHLQSIAAAASPLAPLANLFIDRPYHRSNFTLISKHPEALAEAAVAVSLAALEAIDLQRHTATHPRLGVVDHISCHPLSNTAPYLDLASSTAQIIAKQLGTHGLPCYLYGTAHPAQAQLADIRRQLGYFTPTQPNGIWTGPLDSSTAKGDVLPLTPNYGPITAVPQSGVCCIGAVPLVVNLNVLIDSSDMRAAKEIARVVSQRGGGLEGVQSMALQHDQGIEIACNLLAPEKMAPVVVEEFVRNLAKERGIGVKNAYCTNKSVEEFVKLGQELL